MTDGGRKKEKARHQRKRAEVLATQANAVHLCAYCTAELILVPDTAVYQRSYGGHVWWCQPCEAFVGCHKGGYLPKGRVAKAGLRKLKIEAHALLDAFWMAAIELRGWSKHDARKAAYHWLAEAMGLSSELCHIGMFDDEQTRRVIEICTKAKRATRDSIPK